MATLKITRSDEYTNRIRRSGELAISGKIDIKRMDQALLNLYI